MKSVFFPELWNNQKGAVAVEMAWVAVFICLMMFPLIDLADATLTALKQGAAVDSGILYANKNPTDTSGMATVIQQVSNFDASKLTVQATNFCECNGGPANCTAVCNSGMEQRSEEHTSEI